MSALFRLIGDPSDSTYFFEINPDASRYEPAAAPKDTKSAKTKDVVLTDTPNHAEEA